MAKTTASVQKLLDNQWVGTVERPAGKVYSCVWLFDTEDPPMTPEFVLSHWRKHRDWFRPGYPDDWRLRAERGY